MIFLLKDVTPNYYKDTNGHLYAIVRIQGTDQLMSVNEDGTYHSCSEPYTIIDSLIESRLQDLSNKLERAKDKINELQFRVTTYNKLETLLRKHFNQQNLGIFANILINQGFIIDQREAISIVKCIAEINDIPFNEALYKSKLIK